MDINRLIRAEAQQWEEYWFQLVKHSAEQSYFHDEASVTLMIDFVTIGEKVSIEETVFARFKLGICDDMEFKGMVNGLEKKHNN